MVGLTPLANGGVDMAKTGAERVEAHRQRRKAEIEDLRAENQRLRAGLAATVPPLPAQGEPQAAQPVRKVSATNRRKGQLAEAINSVEALKDDLQASWTAGATASPAASATRGSRWRSGSWKG